VRKTLIAIGLIVLLLIAAPFFIPSESIRIAAEDAASRALGAKVSIEDMSVRLLPMPGVTIRKAVVHAVKEAFPRLKVESGSISLALRPLLRGEIESRQISFNGIFLRISDKARGKAVRAIWIDKLKGTVHLTENKLSLSDWQARLYGGRIKVDAEVSPLDGKVRRISGEAHAAGIQARRLLRDAARQTRLGGTLSSDLKFSASGAEETAFRSSLKVDGPVHLRKGNIYQIELKGVASMLVPGASKGKGDIAYRSLDLELQVRGRDVYARNIRLDSNVANVQGNMAIKEDKSLGGNIGISSLGGLVGIKLRIGGTVDTPRVYPAPSALIGGAIGAGVAGPAGAAVGATVGGSIGTVIEKIGGGLKGLLGGK